MINGRQFCAYGYYVYNQWVCLDVSFLEKLLSNIKEMFKAITSKVCAGRGVAVQGHIVFETKIDSNAEKNIN